MSRSELMEFVELVQSWHAHKVQQLKMVVDAPDSTEIHLGVDDAVVIKNDRDKVLFKAGISAALELLGTLPFSVSTDEED